MEKTVKTTIIIAVTLVVMTLIIVSAINPASNTITSNGQSEIEVMPDLITVYFSIETQGSTSKIAEDKNSEISDSLTAKLIEEGFERTEIQTVSYNIYPDYDWNSGSRKIISYRTSHMVKVELSVEDSEKLGSIVNAATDSDALISSINFELSKDKENEYKAEVLKLAAQDAKMKAKAIADGLGKRLGKLVSTSDNNFYYAPSRIYGVESSEKSLDQATANIQPGEQKITASVTTVYKIY